MKTLIAWFALMPTFSEAAQVIYASRLNPGSLARSEVSEKAVPLGTLLRQHAVSGVETPEDPGAYRLEINGARYRIAAESLHVVRIQGNSLVTSEPGAGERLGLTSQAVTDTDLILTGRRSGSHAEVLYLGKRGWIPVARVLDSVVWIESTARPTVAVAVATVKPVQPHAEVCIARLRDLENQDSKFDAIRELFKKDKPFGTWMGNTNTTVTQSGFTVNVSVNATMRWDPNSGHGQISYTASWSDYGGGQKSGGQTVPMQFCLANGRPFIRALGQRIAFDDGLRMRQSTVTQEGVTMSISRVSR